MHITANAFLSLSPRQLLKLGACDWGLIRLNRTGGNFSVLTVKEKCEMR